MFTEIVETLRSELSDLPDAAETTRLVFRMTLAAFLGGVLGYDREVKGKAAGLRTHMFVAARRGVLYARP
ncbi:MAG: MgtC/SapB family protein [Pirellulales bacterium]